jgi:ATP-dependent Clp protease protease subunit
MEKPKSSREEIWVTKFDEESAQDFRIHLMEHAKGDPTKPVIVYIDSYGGNADALATMIESMDDTPNHIITVCIGKAMSAGAILLSHGDTRLIGPNSRVMVHEMSSGAHGDVHDIYADAIAVKRLNERFMGLLAKNCGFKGGYAALRKHIKSQDGRDKYLDANEALKFGIVDAIGMPHIMAEVQYKLIVGLKNKTKP